MSWASVICVVCWWWSIEQALETLCPFSQLAVLLGQLVFLCILDWFWWSEPFPEQFLCCFIEFFHSVLFGCQLCLGCKAINEFPFVALDLSVRLLWKRAYILLEKSGKRVQFAHRRFSYLYFALRFLISSLRRIQSKRYVKHWLFCNHGANSGRFIVTHILVWSKYTHVGYGKLPFRVSNKVRIWKLGRHSPTQKKGNYPFPEFTMEWTLNLIPTPSRSSIW